MRLYSYTYVCILIRFGCVLFFELGISCVVRRKKRGIKKRRKISFVCVYVCMYVYITRFMCTYDQRNVPPSYRQPYGNGQSLSRRYCKHSERLFFCASCTAREFHGALAVSCKNFKQSKWPSQAAKVHAIASYLSYLRSTRYSSMWRRPFLAAHAAVCQFHGALTSSCKYFKQFK